MLDSLKRIVRDPTKTIVSGVSILLLQKNLERFSTERLSLAMQRAWRREYDPVRFFATDLNGDGAVLKINSIFVTMEHFDRRVDGEKLGGQVLPPWAEHSAHSSITYACPGGIPVSDRKHFYGFLGLLCAELLSENIPSLLFTEEKALLRNSSMLQRSLRSGQDFDPLHISSSS